ncbi:MAG: Fe-S cluster assembly protein SufD [Acetobacteraceae bacterium]
MTATPHMPPGLAGFLDRAGSGEGARLLRETGLPHRRLEVWRYTNPHSLSEQVYAAPSQPDAVTFSALLSKLPDLPGRRVTFVNGVLAEGDAGARARDPDRKPSDTVISPLTVLNGALRQPGLTLEIGEGVDEGIVSLTALNQHETLSSTHLHHHIHLKCGARLILLDFQKGNSPYLANPVYDLDVGPGATLAHIRIIEDSRAAESLSVIEARVAAGGVYNSFTLVLGGALSRQEIYAHLIEEGAAVHINGAQLIGTGQTGDITSVINHTAAHCQSRQTVANVIYGRGKGVFQGKVVVAPHAQKTDGFQMNQALLLSPEAEINSKPELEIYADDVKCSHGATVGAIDDEQLFYLRTRGIDESRAREMLIEAFLMEVIALAPCEALLPFLHQRVAASASLRHVS